MLLADVWQFSPFLQKKYQNPQVDLPAFPWSQFACLPLFLAVASSLDGLLAGRFNLHLVLEENRKQEQALGVLQQQQQQTT